MINKLLSRLEKVRSKSHGEWVACCPAHPDKHPSLGIKLCEDGKVLLHCFTGCSADDIVSAIGLELSDLFPEPVIDYKTKQIRIYFNPATVLQALQYESGVLSLAASDIVNGDVSRGDAERVELAHQRIVDAVTYCFK